MKNGNLADEWKRFHRKFEQYIVETNKIKATKKIKTVILLRTICQIGNNIHENFDFDFENFENDKTDYG